MTEKLSTKQHNKRVCALYIAGSNLKYENWDWNGQWDRVDLNCAYMKVDGFWHHTNCGNKFYFFCQIPMF